ncbi:aminotransferase class I/II-fold pyridoxal phosphate-dependent enzyme [Colwellia sp. D2M02]|uniref:DegT/DnrJ/EryC1/StrS family aminotransferase n=1 Tax=Colwellia sp. D2M02 TaxID=2841562 RepID=UPI001C0A2CE0|nr:aminotransferase class I/II-fold pyridoxal phosphate-dependent enzyme [Colwellia sp. D2M02]
MQKNVYVTRPYFPPIEKYFNYIQGAYDNESLTNNGPLVQELTEKLKGKLGVNHLLLVSNGTVALQIAYRLKELANKNVITTPYTFAATSTALAWQGANPTLANINKNSWNIEPNEVEKLLKNQQGNAIVAVNLFGQPCDLDALELLAQKYNVPLIYDSAHALLSTYKGKSIYEYGDIHCISFHATKLFHTIEGGAMVFKDEADYLLAKKLINFGIAEDGIIEQAGINGKLSEIHAAMGLCVFDDLPALVLERKELIAYYHELLGNTVTYQSDRFPHETQPIYMPVQFSCESQALQVEEALNTQGYYPRRYFMPQHYQFLSNAQTSIINDCSLLANKTLCLPLMNNMKKATVNNICEIILKVLRK